MSGNVEIAICELRLVFVSLVKQEMMRLCRL